MKASGERFLMVGVVVVVLLVVGSIGFQMVTDRNRLSAVAKLKKPEGVQRHVKTHPAQTDTRSSASTQDKNPLPADEQLEANARNESIVAFDRLMERRDAVAKDARWQRAEDILQNKPLKEWTEEDWALVKEYVNATHDLVLEIRKLAAMGGPVSELDYSKGQNMPLAHLAKLRNLGRVLSWDATVRGHDGDYGEAVEDITAGFKLGGVLKDEPILISQLVRIAIDGMCYASAQQALPPEGVPPDLARRLIEYAGQNDYRDSFAGSFNGEGFMGLDTFEHIREGQPVGEENAKDRFLLRLYGSMFARPWLNMDEETYAQTIGRMGELSELPYYEAHPQMQEIEQEVEDLPRTRVFS
jgi:hypothetical protein